MPSNIEQFPRPSAEFEPAAECLVNQLGQYAVICEAVSTNIHDKQEKNPSKKPEGAKPPMVFHEDFSRVWSEYLLIPLRGS